VARGSLHKAYLDDRMDTRPILFDDWQQVLTATIPSERCRAYREAIVKFQAR